MSVPDLTDLQQIARDRYGRRKTVLVHPVTWAAAAVVTSLIFAATRKPTEFSVWLVTAAVSLGLMAFMLYHISGMIYYRWILRSKEPSVYNEMEAAKAAALKAQKEARVAQGVTDELGSTLKEISSERYRDGALMPIASNIIAKKGELFYWRCDNVMSRSEHTHSRYVTRRTGQRSGGYAGVSFRVARGVYLHSGAYGGPSSSVSVGERETWTSVDTDDEGTLWLSNQRLILMGNRREIEIPYKSVTSVTPYFDGLRVDTANHKPLLLHSRSPREAVVLQRLIAGQIVAPEAALAAEAR